MCEDGEEQVECGRCGTEWRKDRLVDSDEFELIGCSGCDVCFRLYVQETGDVPRAWISHFVDYPATDHGPHPVIMESGHGEPPPPYKEIEDDG